MKLLAAFRLLEFDQKCDTLIRDGNFLACRAWASEGFICIQQHPILPNIYSIKYKRVLLINEFDQSTGLEPYLDMISLADLYSSPMS